MSKERHKGHDKKARSAKLQTSVANLKAAIKAGVHASLMDDPDVRPWLEDTGLLDGDVVSGLSSDAGLDAALAGMQAAIAEEVAARPSVLDEYDVRALDVLTAEDDPGLPSAGVVQVERTVVFSDLEGFTSFTRDKGDLEASALLADHYQDVEAIVRGRGGTVMKKLGDGHMLSFEQPAAAVMAAVDLVAAAPGSLRLRAGAHAGEVVATGDDLLGDVVNLAARVTDLADGGETVVTTVVRAGAGSLPRIVYEPSRFETVPGIEVPVEVCLVRAG